MFNASPLFNGQNGTGIYDGIVNKDGEKLFNTEYDENRWRQAAEAADAAGESGRLRSRRADTAESV